MQMLIRGCRIVFGRNPSEQKRTWKGNDLGQEQCQKQSGTVESECLSVSGCHIDDGIDAVDIEEKGDEEEQYLFFLADFTEGMTETAETVADHMSACGFCIIFLLIVFQHRQGGQEPPCRGDDKSNHHGCGSGKSERSGSQYHTETGNERNTASDISPGISTGRNGIHPVFGGDVGQHGIVEDQAGGISGFGDDIED